MFTWNDIYCCLHIRGRGGGKRSCQSLMSSSVTAGFDVISFDTVRLQAVYCILLPGLLLGSGRQLRDQRSKARS